MEEMLGMINGGDCIGKKTLEMETDKKRTYIWKGKRQWYNTGQIGDRR